MRQEEVRLIRRESSSHVSNGNLHRIAGQKPVLDKMGKFVSCGGKVRLMGGNVRLIGRESSSHVSNTNLQRLFSQKRTLYKVGQFVS